MVRVSALLPFLALALAAVSGQSLADTPPIEVGTGQAQVLRFDHPVKHIVIGDPGVADVSLQSPKIVVIFGRAVGVTTLSIMDGNGKALVEAPVVVTAGGAGGVEVTYASSKDAKTLGGTTASYVCGGGTCTMIGAPPGGSTQNNTPAPTGGGEPIPVK